MVIVQFYYNNLAATDISESIQTENDEYLLYDITTTDVTIARTHAISK